ncbi:protein ren [Superficieibacter electus]|uniref:Protein ren n=1 Tax=Superficieibacter electus TaxID=2022662 RepID=A0A2P5GSV1_9ENTR|nr:protein ren [Superficieibacter electus]POP46900.1 protein ren [Superficieibacter electus]POP49637.1 protein ren [Superficieibacter electus]
MRGKQAILRYLTTHHTFSPAQVARESGLTVNCIATVARGLAQEGVLILESKVWRSVTYRLATDAERRNGGCDGINTIFADCRKSDAMKRVLSVYGRL